jgi:tetratricopeptide (TPR) repeat protein
MTKLSTYRRLELALAGIAISAFVLHGQLADALVVRGDECLYRAHPELALRYYRRAIRIDSGDGVAIDRLLFVAMTLHDRATLRDGIRSASRYLLSRPYDSAVRFDRAMAYRATGDQEKALGDFADVGRRTRDARALAFAGFAAQTVGQFSRARHFWRLALALAPGFPAAAHALGRANASPRGLR